MCAITDVAALSRGRWGQTRLDVRSGDSVCLPVAGYEGDVEVSNCIGVP